MRRREFMAGLAGAAVWPLPVRAQQSAMPVIAFLTNASFDGWADRRRAFGQALREAGFVEGRNLAIEFHKAEGDDARLSVLAADLVRRRVNVIVTNGSATIVAKSATSTIPIVFLTGADPVDVGVVASLNRPGGNLTGMAALGDSLGPKRLELLREIAPTATDIGVLVNPGNPSNEVQTKDLRAASQILGVRLHLLNASAQQDFDPAFASFVNLRAGALVITVAPLFNNCSEQLAALAAQHAIPAVYQYRNFVAGGGLMSLGTDAAEQYRLLGVYAGRILKGERPADLPVQQSTKVELFINLMTARALGLTVPLTLRARADEVIE
jgi:putative tryptophan/tyrosine transport system substrate-binding protein